MTTPSFLRQDLRVRFLALVGILILANILLAGVILRADLTKDKIYTLNPSSQAIVQRLQRPLQVKGYFTKDLQAPYNSYEQTVRDKLDEYVAYANGNLRYEFIDPTGDEELEAEARRFGISPAKIDYRSRDQREIKTAYMGLTFVYGDEQEVIPILRNPDSLEYEISRIIKGLTSDGEEKTVAFLQGHKEPDLLRPSPQGGANPLRQALDENYNVTTVDMSGSTDIDDDVDALIVFAPLEEVPERHQFEIDQFIMQGKPVAFFLPSHLADTRSNRLNPIQHGLEGLLKGYGVDFSKKLILDRRQNGRTRYPIRQGRLVFQALVNYPLYPISTDLERESPIVRDTEAMIMPMTQSLSLTEAAKNNPELIARALITSSEYSTRKKSGEPPVDPQQLMKEELATNEEPGPFVMAYTLEGKFKSAWASKPLPEDEDGTLEGRVVLKESPENRLLMVGGAEFIQSSSAVFLNMIDWIAQDEDLISIRSRGPSAPPLRVIEPSTQQLVSIANVAGVPLLFVLFGLIRWQLRRRARRNS